MAVSYGTFTITEIQEGSQIWTTAIAPTSPDYTFTISNLTGDSDTSVKVGDIIMYSYYRYTVLSISDNGTKVLTGNRTSIRGGTGESAITYNLIISTLAIIKDKNGDISPTSINLTAKSQTGSGSMTNYAGRFTIETTTDNITWTNQYTSSSNEATKVWNVINNIIAIRCSLYLKDGTSILLDQQTIPIISDGIDGKDGYSIILTNDNHTFAGDSTHAIASEVECNVIAYKGATQIAATIGTITGQPIGMTTTLLNNGTTNAAFNVSVTTLMVTKNGTLTIPITVDGKTFTKKFTYSLALDGISVINVTSTNNTSDGGTSVITVTMSDGSTKTFNVKNGSKGSTGDTAEWFYGIELIHTSGTATATITGAVIGSMYLNTETSLVYKCTDITNGTMTWTYAGDLTTGIINSVDIVGDNLFKSLPYIPPTRVIGSNNVTYAYDLTTGTYTLTVTQTNNVDFGQFYTLYGVTNVNAILGKEVTLSAESISCTNPTAVPRVYFYAKKSDDSVYSYFIGSGGSLKKTFIVTADTVLAGYIIRGDQNKNLVIGDVATFKGVKLEFGNKATRWIPSIDDIISEGGKTATNFLSVDSSGIMVADMNYGEEQTPSNANGNNVFINNTSVNIRDGQTTLASFGNDGAQIGLSDKSHINQDYHSWQMVDKEGTTYAYISDLRDETGKAEIVEPYAEIAEYTGDPYCARAIKLLFPVSSISSIISITINETPVQSFELLGLGNSTSTYYVKTTPLPNDTDMVTVTYLSWSQLLKAYTFGRRETNSRLGGYSFVSGYRNTADGFYSHAEGFTTTASGMSSHVEGYESIADGFSSHAEGRNTRARGNESHVEGYSSIANGFTSHAEGYGTTASGSYSHAEGYGTTALSNYQHVQGKWNISDANNEYAFIIGNGNSSNRSNAFTVDWDGNVAFSGNMYSAGGNYLSSGTNINYLTKKHSGWWLYNRSNVSGTFPVSDTYGTIGHIQGTSDNVGMQFIRSNNQSQNDNILYVRFKMGGTWGSWQKYVSAQTTSLTINRVTNSYFNATDVTYLYAYKKNGFLTLKGNLHLSASLPTGTENIKIATISGWNSLPSSIMCVPAQNGNATLMVDISTSGDITISNYSGTNTNSQGWFRFMLTVPCADGYE